MFCENCGSPVTAETKFCKNCGASQTSSNQSQQPQPSEQPLQQHPPQQAAPSYTAPAPFQQYSSVDPHQPVYQKQVFHGKQFSTGSSGHMSFGGGAQKKKGGCLKFVLIAVVASVVLVIGAVLLVALLGGGSGISNATIASQVDPQTNLPVTPTTVFSSDFPKINCTFEANVDPGTIVAVEWWYTTNNELITIYHHPVMQNGEQVNATLSKPTAGWPVGNYEVRIYVGEKHAVTRKFSVK